VRSGVGAVPVLAGAGRDGLRYVGFFAMGIILSDRGGLAGRLASFELQRVFRHRPFRNVLEPLPQLLLGIGCKPFARIFAQLGQILKQQVARQGTRNQVPIDRLPEGVGTIALIHKQAPESGLLGIAGRVEAEGPLHRLKLQVDRQTLMRELRDLIEE
jgi:hypothetical protein